MYPEPRQPDRRTDAQRRGDHTGVAVRVDDRDVGGVAVALAAVPPQCVGECHGPVAARHGRQRPGQRADRVDQAVEVVPAEHVAAGQQSVPDRQFQDAVPGEVGGTERAAAGPDGVDHESPDPAGVEHVRPLFGQRLQRGVEAGVEQQVAAAEQAPVRLVDLRAGTGYQRRCHRGERVRLLVRQGDAAAGDGDGRLDDPVPRQPAPAAVHLGDPGRYPGYRDAGAADRVAERYPAERDLDRHHRAGRAVAVGTRYRAEEVQAGDLAGTGLEVGGEAAAADAGEDALRAAADQCRGGRRVGGRAAPGENAQTGFHGGRVAGRDSGGHADLLWDGAPSPTA